LFFGIMENEGVLLKNKANISITIDPELIKWIDDQIAKKRFANRSHGIEYALYRLMEQR